jgi:hypothetical protein
MLGRCRGGQLTASLRIIAANCSASGPSRCRDAFEMACRRSGSNQADTIAKGEPSRFALRFPSLMMITSIVIATCRAIWHGIVRASRSWNAHRDGGDRQRERQCYPAQHDQSPCRSRIWLPRTRSRSSRFISTILVLTDLAPFKFLFALRMRGSHCSDPQSIPLSLAT